MRKILAIDLGTTIIKAVLFDENGVILDNRKTKFSLIDKSNDEIEQKPALLWIIVKKIIKKIITDTGIDNCNLQAIGLSSQGISIIPVDKNYSCLYNMISWLDTRAANEVKEIKARFSEKDLFHITGKRLTPFYSLPKILWLKKNEPELFNQIYKILLPLDYIFFKLTGEVFTDHTMAGGTMLYDITERNWSKQILSAFNIKSNILPKIENAGEFSLPISGNVASELDLQKNTQVVLGAQDQKCAAIGAGIDEDTAVISMGTCTAILAECDRPFFDEQMRIPLFSFIKKNRYVLEAVINTTGIVFEWIKKTFFKNKSFDELTALAQKSPTGCKGLFFYPHLEGAGTPHLGKNIKGFLYGLSLSIEKNDIIRSLMEGVAFQIRENINVIEEIRDKEIKKVKLIGGCAKSDFWCSIISDVLNREVMKFESSEVASKGAAIIAGVESEIFKDFNEGFKKMVGKKNNFYPNKNNSLKYDKIFNDYIYKENLLFSRAFMVKDQ